MKHRKLRIAWSVIWGIVAVLLIALWVRSYWCWDSFGFYGRTHSCAVTSASGVLMASVIEQRGGGHWDFGSRSPIDPPDLVNQLSVGWYNEQVPVRVAIVFPHWLIVLAFSVLAVAPWMVGRFTVRNLLILTACVATVLGVLAHFSRW